MQHFRKALQEKRQILLWHEASGEKHDPGVKTTAPPAVKEEQKKQMTGGSSM